MVSRRYRTYKFRYTNDLGNNIIKRQRSYLDEFNNEITPITALFVARVVAFEEVVTGTSVGLRHLLTYIDDGQFKANIPYTPGSINLVNHIKEILAVNRVICGDYIGEKQVSGGTSTNFL